VVNNLPAADQAVNLTPTDPQAHRARAAVLNVLRRPAEARTELETAVSLRTRDDYLWLELGNVRDELDDQAGALVAFDEAVRWAPFYAHTHWQRGNLKLRMGRYDEAFAELRGAAVSNQNFLPNLVDLAYGVARGDARTAEQLLQINDDKARLAFCRFLAKKGKGNEALEQYRLLRHASAENSKAIMLELIDAKSYRSAFEIWKLLNSSGPGTDTAFYDGGFEGPLTFDEHAFGWIVSRGRVKTTIALDVSQRQSGAKSLQVAFAGNSNPGESLLSQTLIVKPGQRYQVSFSVSTKDIVTGGPPLIVVSDAASGQPLGKSASLPIATSAWQTMSLDFTTLPVSEAIVLTLQRSCTVSPCPIFGVMWLDNFSIVELKESQPTS
jgi:tetratricopeptide (TPR) repeat protein